MQFKEVLKTLEGMGFSGIENKCGFKAVYLDDSLYKWKESKKFMKKISSANILKIFKITNIKVLDIPAKLEKKLTLSY